MDFFSQKHIHLIGIGGIGVSALARLFRAHGVRVTGSDVAENEETAHLRAVGITVAIGHRSRHLEENTDAVVYSSAVLEDNPERKRAEELKIPQFSYTEALGVIMDHYEGIAVSGTNGKTTTTALAGKMFEAAGNDPTVVVGGHVPGWDRNLRIGRSRFFIAEGCEYRRNMLNLRPKAIVMTNIEEDHLDYYKDITDIENAFAEYISRIPEDGIIVYNHDDPRCRALVEKVEVQKVSYGFQDGAHMRIVSKGIVDGMQVFSLVFKETLLAEFETALPGRFNLSNIAAAATLAYVYGGVEVQDISDAVSHFKGTWRRFERVGMYGNAFVVSDYAHHPTAVAATIQGAKELYPNRRVIAVFQPHQKDRTIKLFNEFVKAFDEADEIILAEVYEVAGRNNASQNISSNDLVEAIRKRNPKAQLTFAANLDEIVALLETHMGKDELILIMGAGDIDKVARMIVR